MVPDDDQIRGKPDLFHGGLESISPRARGLQALWSCNERDSCVAQRSQVLDCLSNSVQIVDSDICNAWNIRSYIDKDERNLPVAKVFN